VSLGQISNVGYIQITALLTALYQQLRLTTWLHGSMKTRVTRRQAFGSSSEKQAGVEKQYVACKAQKAELSSRLNRNQFCYTSDFQPGVRVPPGYEPGHLGAREKKKLNNDGKGHIPQHINLK